MAKLISPFFRRSLLISGSVRMLSGPSRASLLIAESIVFPQALVETVYIGPSSRSSRYLGNRTDSEIYLGNKVLFP